MVEGVSLYTNLSKEDLDGLLLGVKQLLTDIKNPENLKASYDRFDQNKDGHLSLQEFTTMLIGLHDLFHHYITRDEVAKKFKEADTNHNHKIEKREFKPALKHILSSFAKDFQKELKKRE